MPSLIEYPLQKSESGQKVHYHLVSSKPDRGENMGSRTTGTGNARGFPRTSWLGTRNRLRLTMSTGEPE
jgi:hypothetical protein